MIKVYHASMTRSVRVLWLLEELGLPYEVVVLDFMAGDLQKPAYLAKNPLGRVPALEDGDVLMYESGAIVEWLCERYDAAHLLAPAPGTPARARFLQWLHWAEATAMPPVSDFFAHSMIRPEAERIPQVVADAVVKVAQWLAVLERHLLGKDFLLGSDFSAADVMMGYTVGGAKFTGQLDERFPNVAAYLGRLMARPAYQKANAR
jgi:glutathione S-transferase